MLPFVTEGDSKRDLPLRWSFDTTILIIVGAKITPVIVDCSIGDVAKRSIDKNSYLVDTRKSTKKNKKGG